MSAYHPPPPFGGLFNAHTQYPPSSGGNHTVMPSFHYQQVQDPNVQRHGEMGIPLTQFANAYSFSSNAQTPKPPMPSNGVPSTSFAGYDSAPTRSFPPPPFPPVPIPPHGPFPHSVPLLHHQVANTGSAQPPISLPQKPPPHPGPAKQLDLGSGTVINAVAATSDLEDGELSDGEPTKHSKEPKIGYRSSPRLPAGKVNDSRQKSRRDQHSNANGGYRSPNETFSQYSPGHHPRLKHFGQSPVHSPSIESPKPINQTIDRRGHGRNTPNRWTGRDSMHSNGLPVDARYSPKVPGDSNQQPTTHEVKPSQPLTSVSQPTKGVRSNATTSTAGSDLLVNGHPPPDTKIATEIRGRAKTALQELYPHKISYTKLVQEGLDSSLLFELYNEMGIRLASPVPSKQNLDSAGLQQETSIAPRASITDNGLGGPGRPQLPLASPVATTTTSCANGNIVDQNPVVSVGHASRMEQKTHEEGSEGSAGDQPPQSSQVSDVRLNVSSPQVVNKRGPTLPSKVNLPPKMQVNNTNIGTVAAITTDTKLDPTMTSTPAKPSPSAFPINSAMSKSGDKTLERKDYIARMLAAKAGKPKPALTASSPSTTTVTHKVKTITQPSPAIDHEYASTPEQCRLYLGNLAYSTKEGDLRALFGGYSIEEVWIPTNPRTAEPVGYGFVQLSTHSEAQRAISELAGTRLHDRKISCQMARKPETASKTVEPAAQVVASMSYEGSRDALAEQEANVEAKRKAQTDLARQKIEALKSRTVSQRETPLSSSIVQPAVRPHPLPEIPPTSTLHKSLTSGAHVSNHLQATAHGSYFSPTNDRQPFSIPGLFMASARSASTTDIEQPMAIPPAASRESSQPDPTVLSTDNTMHSQTLLTQSTSTSRTNGKPGSIFTSETLGKLGNSASRVNEPRKRQKASDFIDSPPRKANRTLEPKENVSVIIDVSEEEVNEGSEDEVEAMDIEQNLQIDTHLRQLEHDDLENGKQRTILDLPPLTGFSVTKKVSDNSAFMTPPAVQTPGKAKEPEGLKTKEKEIELMKRRIAELELRNKAKQTSSRAQTPGTPGHARSSPRPVETSVGGNELPTSSVDMKVSAESVQERAQTKAKPIAVSGPEITQKIIGLEETTELQEEEKDLVTAASKILHPFQKAASEEEQLGKSINHISEELEPARMEIDQSEAAQVANWENKAPLQLVEQQAKEIANAQAEADRLQVTESAARAEEQQSQLTEQRVNNLGLANAEFERSRSAESVTTDDQRRRRRTEIEFGLPMLDAEVERTKQRLQSLRKQMEDLESEVQKGIEGRRILMDELVNLSPALSPAPRASSQERHGLAERLVEKPQTTNKDEIQDSQPTVDNTHQQARKTVSRITTPTNEAEISALKSQTELSSPTYDVDQTGNGESAEDVMDISRSDVDEGEITEYSPEPLGFVEDQPPLPGSEDAYEPPLTIDPVPLYTPSSQQGATVSRVAGPDPSQIMLNGPREDTGEFPSSKASSESSEDTNESGEILAASRSQSLNDDSDPDDYEPPEPAIPVEAPTPTLNHDIDSAETVFSPRHPNSLRAIQSLPNSVAPAVQDRVQSIATELVDTAYPTAVEPVSNNDMVLVQMGAIPAGFSPQEGDAYVGGLRQVIQEIRGRKVKDFNQVAAEISAYRARFLGDRSKVLPLGT